MSVAMLKNDPNAQSHAAGEFIFRRGDAGSVMYAVAEGEVDVCIGDHVIETVGAGGIFGEMALIGNDPRSATAVARSACRVVPIDRRRFDFLVQQTPFFAIEVMRVMADRLRRTTVATHGGA
jgi:CRP-like cAMP-binding protein